MSRVLLVDSQPAMRRAVAELLEQMHHTLVGEADTGQDALRLFRQDEPDLVILELAAEHLGGLELLRRLRARSSQIRLLVYSVQDAKLFAGLCLRAGADGYVGKNEAMAQLASGISVVLGGRRFFPRDAVDVRRDAPAVLPLDHQELQHLSAREITVLQLLAQGQSNLEIAKQLSISFKTVSTYKTRLLEKLHAGSLVELANIARRNGLTAQDTPAPLSSDLSAEQEEHLYLLQAMVDGSPFAMFMRDMQGRLLLCNHHFLQQHGATPAVIGTYICQAHWFAPEQAQYMQERYLDCVARGDSYVDDVLVTLHGHQRVLHMWGVPYRDQKGALLGMVGGSQDLTEQDRELADLRASTAQAQADCVRKNLLLQVFATELSESNAERTPNRRSKLELLLMLEVEGLSLQPQRIEVAELTARILVHFQAITGKPVPLQIHTDASVWLDPLRYQQLLESMLAVVPAPQVKSLELQLEQRTGGRAQLRLHLELEPPEPIRKSLDFIVSSSLATHMGGGLEVSTTGIEVMLWFLTSGASG